MILDNFHVIVPEGREVPDGRVFLADGTVYTIELGNNHPVRCDASVHIDDKLLGTFRIDPKSAVVLRNDVRRSGKFTFVVADSKAAVQAGVTKIDEDMRGLIKVEFRKEYVNRLKINQEGFTRGMTQSLGLYPPFDTELVAHNIPDSAELSGVASASIGTAGITALTGNATQRFRSAESIEYDTDVIVIYLRLVGTDDIGVKELHAIDEIVSTSTSEVKSIMFKPVTYRSTNIPPTGR